MEITAVPSAHRSDRRAGRIHLPCHGCLERLGLSRGARVTQVSASHSVKLLFHPLSTHRPCSRDRQGQTVKLKPAQPWQQEGTELALLLAFSSRKCLSSFQLQSVGLESRLETAKALLNHSQQKRKTSAFFSLPFTSLLWALGKGGGKMCQWKMWNKAAICAAWLF